MEKAVSERRKACAAAHKIMKTDRLTSLFSDMPPLSSPKPRLMHDKRHAFLSPKSVYFFFVLSLALLPHFPSLLTFLTVPLPTSRL